MSETIVLYYSPPHRTVAVVEGFGVPDVNLALLVP